MKKCFYYLFAFSSLTHFCYGQTFDPILTTKLQNTIDSMKIANNIKGISASIIYPGQGMWKGVTGESHSGTPITPDMEFHIASNTKTFTAVMFLKLVENNLVSLDDSLYEWLPNYNSNIDSNITIRQMLNHVSGIANTFDVMGFMDSLSTDWNRVFTTPEILSWLPAPLFTAGSGQSYSNPNYFLTGLIIESVTGQSLEQLLRDSIFTPLGLDSTFFPIYDTIQGIIAHPWQTGVDYNDTSRTSLLTSNWSAGAIYSTSSEMAHWYNELMNNQFLNTSEYNEMTTMVGPQKRGLGIQEINIAGRTVWGHGGGTIGYGSAMVYDTTSHAVIAVLVNDAQASPISIAEVLLQTLINNPVTGIDNVNESQMVVIYPNPTDDKIKLSIEPQKVKSIKIYDSNGLLLKEFFTTEISISELSSGQYFIVIQTDKKVITKKIIKH